MQLISPKRKTWDWWPEKGKRICSGSANQWERKDQNLVLAHGPVQLCFLPSPCDLGCAIPASGTWWAPSQWRDAGNHAGHPIVTRSHLEAMGGGRGEQAFWPSLLAFPLTDLSWPPCREIHPYLYVHNIHPSGSSLLPPFVGLRPFLWQATLDSQPLNHFRGLPACPS